MIAFAFVPALAAFVQFARCAVGKFFAQVGMFLLALFIAHFLLSAIGISDALKETDKRPAPATREQLESLCIAGNANACKVYEVRYKQRCIL